jgi:hypothetical protein
MTYTFAISEYADDRYAFSHGAYQVDVHLHPVFSDPALFETCCDQDPMVAWIFITHGKAGRLVLNAQYDPVMNPPFFFNQHEGAFGVSLQGTGRATLWTRDELTASIRACLDRLQPPATPAKMRPWWRFW